MATASWCSQHPRTPLTALPRPLDALRDGRRKGKVWEGTGGQKREEEGARKGRKEEGGERRRREGKGGG